jgi:hypothetical protein
MGWTAEESDFDSRQGQEIFIFCGSGAHLASYAMVTGNCFPGGKAGREADYRPQCSAEIKNGGAIPSLPHTSSWRGA